MESNLFILILIIGNVTILLYFFFSKLNPYKLFHGIIWHFPIIRGKVQLTFFTWSKFCFCFDFRFRSRSCCVAGNSNFKTQKIGQWFPPHAMRGVDVISKSLDNTFFCADICLEFRLFCSTWCPGQPAKSPIFLTSIGHTVCSHWSMCRPLP